MSVLGLVKLKPRQFDFRSSAQSTRVILALTEIEVDIDGSTDASRSTGITYFQSDFFVAWQPLRRGEKREREREREKRRKKAISLITVEEHEVEAQLHNENATAKSQSPIGSALYREFLAKFRDEWQSSLQLFRCHTEALCAFDWQYSLSMKLSDWTRQTRDTQQRCD